MTTYTVHAPPDAPEAVERMRFVKDGFSWPALFFPIIWILWHRMWVTLVWYIAFVLVIMWTGRLLGEDSAQVVAILGALLFALEANDIRRRSLASKGWIEQGGSFGRRKSEAEMRYFGTWRRPPGTISGAGSTEKREAIARAAYSPSARHAADEPVFGLFPEPER